MWLGDWSQVLWGMGPRAEENTSWGDREPLTLLYVEVMLIWDRKKTLLSAYCMLTPCWKFHSASHLILMSILREGPHFHLIPESKDIRWLYQGHAVCVTGLVPKPAWVLFCLLGSVEQTRRHQVELGYWETIKERRKTQKLLFNR